MSDVGSVNNYSSLINTLTGSSAAGSSVADSSATKSNGELSTDSFFKLLASQLQNQDMSNPMNNSEMMTQITQIAMMQAMKNFSTSMDDFAQINMISYGTSMMGKDVTLGIPDKTGQIKKINGTVSRVDIFSGVPTLYLSNDDKTGYSLANIMSVYEKGQAPKEKEPDKTPETTPATPPATTQSTDTAANIDKNTDSHTDTGKNQ